MNCTSSSYSDQDKCLKLQESLLLRNCQCSSQGLLAVYLLTTGVFPQNTETLAQADCRKGQTCHNKDMDKKTGNSFEWLYLT